MMNLSSVNTVNNRGYKHNIFLELYDPFCFFNKELYLKSKNLKNPSYTYFASIYRL